MTNDQLFSFFSLLFSFPLHKSHLFRDFEDSCVSLSLRIAVCLLFLPLKFCFLGGAFGWGITSSGEKISSVTIFVNGC